VVATTEVPVEQPMEAFTSLGLWVEPVTPPMNVAVQEVGAVGRHEPRREQNGPPATSSPTP
jgi:hypothetical protein